jgi:hypothetical protein
MSRLAPLQVLTLGTWSFWIERVMSMDALANTI